MSEGVDAQRFVREREPGWKELEALLDRAEREGVSALGLTGARRLGQLYRRVSADLVVARGALLDAPLQSYLNDVVARAYGVVHGGQRHDIRAVLAFFAFEVPALVRREWRVFLLSWALFLGGAAIGAAGMIVDPHARHVLLPEQHQAQTPDERIASEVGDHGAGDAAEFSSFLFTHNIQVAFTAFALGITFGVGTVAVMLYNGVPIGALAVQYHQAGHGLFFWSWILPHGVPEITAIAIGGAAGLIIARGLVLPGRKRRRDAVVDEGRTAVKLALGTMPILVVAGLIEGTISQLHPPVVPYAAKLAVAALVGIALAAWLGFAGRGRTFNEAR